MNDKDLIIEVTDYYGDCLSDKSSGDLSSKKSNTRPQGFVEIYEVDRDNDKKELIGKSNLVVYLGREMLISSAFKVKNENITPLETDFICWFGVGSGGCPILDPLTPTAPTVNDSDLSNSVMISATDAGCGDLRVSPVSGYYKHLFDSVIFQQDSENYNRWLIARIDTTLGADDANGYNLNEAGLFAASSKTGGFSGQFSLYAKVTFPTIVKSSARQLLFIWYVYF